MMDPWNGPPPRPAPPLPEVVFAAERRREEHGCRPRFGITILSPEAFAFHEELRRRERVASLRLRMATALLVLAGLAWGGIGWALVELGDRLAHGGMR